MGRQAHIIRSALGRSPFGEPFRDENGDFVLGPHAHDNEAPGYRQQFDDHGHPQNRSSKTAARKLRRAQNDVLATVGVVVKIGEERKSKWEKLSEKGKRRLIDHENHQGRELKGEDRLLGLLLPWSISCLRKRLMTFGPYFVLPITELIPRECRVLGFRRFLYAGLAFHLLGAIPQICRNYLCDPDVEEHLSYINHWRNDSQVVSLRDRALQSCKKLFFQCIEMPLMVHSTLQILSLISPDTMPNWRFFIPLSNHSPISILNIPVNMNITSATNFIVDVVHEPLFLYLLRDCLHIRTRYRLYGLFRQLFIKPDRPDAISANVADDTDSISETSIAGIGYPWPIDDPDYERGKRYHGKKSFWGAISITFPWIYKLANYLSRERLARSRGRLTPLLERQLQAAIREKYWDQRSRLEHPLPRRGSPEDISFRTNVVNSVFACANLVPGEELVNPVAWTNDTLGPKADVLGGLSAELRDWNRSARPPSSSEIHQDTEHNRRQTDAANSVIVEAFQATPTSDAVVIQANDGQIVMATQRTPHDPLNVAEMNNIHTIQAADVPLQVLLRALESMETEGEQGSDSQIQPPPETQGEEPQRFTSTASSPPTPTPGISRAPSLTDPQIQGPSSPSTTTPLRPIRRPTETDDSLAAISETLRAEVGSLQIPTRADNTLADNSNLSRGPSPRQRPPSQPQTFHQTIGNDPPVTADPDPPLVPFRHRKYRVTTLSNHPADSLAWHASGLLTSFVLWPLEAMWLRSVARWATSNPAMGGVIDPWWAARLGYGVLGGQLPTAFGVLELNTWFGGATDVASRFTYVGGVVLCLGVEGAVRGACWTLGVWCVNRWKERYGWGHF